MTTWVTADTHFLPKDSFVWVKDYYEMTVGSRTVVMCHYPMVTWNKKHYGAVHLHGHSHGTLQTTAKNRYDIGTDTNDFKPYNMKELLDETTTSR